MLTRMRERERCWSRAVHQPWPREVLASNPLANTGERSGREHCTKGSPCIKPAGEVERTVAAKPDALVPWVQRVARCEVEEMPQEGEWKRCTTVMPQRNLRAPCPGDLGTSEPGPSTCLLVASCYMHLPDVVGECCVV